MEFSIFFSFLLLFLSPIIMSIFFISILRKDEKQPQIFRYFKKGKIMTDREEIMFRKLQSICGSSLLVFPQIHLSSILNHYIKGQNFNRAFRFINSHSVDFVLCDSRNLKPLLAIELDDKTHNSPERQKRDDRVNEIFKNSNFPLLRINSIKIENNELKNRIIQALK